MIHTFKAINPTPDTAIASAVTAAFADTAALLSVRNGGDKQIRMNYVRLYTTVVPASATRSELVVAVDGPGAARRASGGTALTGRRMDIGIRNPGLDMGTATGAVIHFGAVVTNAETTNVRRIARTPLRSAIQIVRDEYVIVFGPKGKTLLEHVHQASGTAAALRTVVHVGPAELGNNCDCLLHVWHPGNATTPASYEVEVCYDEGS